MPSYTVDVPGLGSYTVDSPTDLSDYQAYLAVKRQIEADQARIEPAKNIGEAAMGGTKRMLSSMGTALSAPFIGATEAAEAGIGRGEKITERPGASLEKLQSVYESQGLWPAIKEGASQIPTAIAEQAPNLAAMMGGARLGATAGAPFGPWGVGAGALLGAAVPSYLQQAGSNIERQAQEDIAAGRPVDVSGAAAATTAIPQAALDVVAGRISMGRLLGLKPATLGTEAAEKLAQQSLTRATLTGIAKSPFAEIPTEVTQQMLERAQAGLPLTTDDAIQEYQKIAYQTAMLAPLGGVEGVQTRSRAQTEVEQADQQRAADIAAIQHRQAGMADVFAQSQALADQEAADIAGKQAVQEEIGRFDTETKQRAVDTLGQILAQKNIPEEAVAPQETYSREQINELLTTKEGAKVVLNKVKAMFPGLTDEDYASIKADLKERIKVLPTKATLTEQKATSEYEDVFSGQGEPLRSRFDDTLVRQLGFSNAKKYAEITDKDNGTLSPLYGLRLSDSPGAVINRLEHAVKKLEEMKIGAKSQSELDNYERIQGNINDFLTRTYGSEQERTVMSKVEPIDQNWQAALSQYFSDMRNRAGLPLQGQEGYRFTQGEQYQPDLLHPGESVNNPVLNPPVGERRGQEVLQGVDALRGGAYDPNTNRQLDLGFEGEPSGAGVEGDLRARGERARTEALNLRGVEGTGRPAVSPDGAEGGRTDTLAQREAKLQEAQAQIQYILEDTSLATPEQQAEGVNKIASIMQSAGLFGEHNLPAGRKMTPENRAALQQAYIQQALDITKQFSKWPAQPEGPAVKATSPREKTMDMEKHASRVSAAFNPVWGKIAEGKTGAKNRDGRRMVEKVSDIVYDLEDALSSGNQEAAKGLMHQVDVMLDSEEMRKNTNSHAKKVLQAARTAVQDLAGADHDLQGSRRKKSKFKQASRVEASETPATVDQVQTELGKLIAEQHLARNPAVVVQNYSDLPSEVQAEAEQRGLKAFVQHGGQDYYIAENIPSNDVRGTIMHERGVHIGMTKLLGQGRINALANRVLAWGVDGKGLEARIAKEAIDLADASGESIGSDRHNQEVVAYFTEIAVNRYGIDPLKAQPKEYSKIAGWLREVWNGVLSALKKLHYDPKNLNAKDIVNLVYGSARVAETEGGVEGEVQGAKMPAHLQQFAARGRELEPLRNAYRHAVNTYGEKSTQAQKAWQALQAAEKGVQGSVAQPTQAEIAAAAAQGRRMWTQAPEHTRMDRIKARVGNDVLGWLGVKIVGGDAALAMKGTDMFGPEARLLNGKELGYLNYQRALHDTDLATGAAQFGYLELDKEGVFHIRDSQDNMVNLNKLHHDIKARMMADGMSEAVANDAFAKMALCDRAQELIQMGVINPQEFTPQEIAYGKQMQQQYAPEYKAWHSMYQRIRARTMKAAVDSGLFTPKKAQEFLDRMEYVPFNRDQPANVSDGVFLRSLLSAKAEYHIKGSELQISDVMDNIVDNQVWLMKRAIRNNASNLIADTMEEMHRRNPLMGGHPVNPGDRHANDISYLKNGKEQWFRVLDKNDAAIFTAAPAIGSTALHMFRGVANILRKGVTLTPSFIYNQTIQDAMRAPIVTGTKAGMAGILRKSVPEMIKNAGMHETPLAKAMRRAGIVGQYDYQDTYDNWKKEMFGAKREGFSKLIEAGERWAQANDMATRAAVYDDILKQTGDANEASLRALMMINFQNRGHSTLLANLMATVPFVNSRIQGEYRLLMALTGRIPGVTKQQAKELVAWRLAKMAAFTALYAMARSGDDDYEKANEEVKNGNFLFGGVKVPVAPELLPLKVAIEKSYRLATDQQFETNEKAARAEMAAIAGMAFGITDVTPTLVKPIIENMTNYSFFSGRPLVGYHQQGMDVNMQFNEGTSEISKMLSNFMQGIGGNTINVSPIKLDNLIRGWFGSIGRDVLYTTDMMVGDKPAPKSNQYPVLGAMMYDMEGGSLTSDFYQLRDKAGRAMNTFNELKMKDPEAAKQYLEENRPLLQIYTALNKINQYLTAQRKMRDMWTRQDPATAREKIDQQKAEIHEKLKVLLPPIMARLEGME